MPKRPDNLETVVLTVELLRRIPRNRKVTISELQEQLREAGFERDVRSIQRHLKVLSQHFEIECDNRSKPYGYRWLANAKGLEIPNMTPQESLLLRLVEDHLRDLLPPNLMKSLDGFFTQAQRTLGNPGQAHLEREWPGKVRVVADGLRLMRPIIEPGVFETVSEALYANHYLDIEYRNFEGKRWKSRVMPLGLVQQGPRMYLVCRFEGRMDERHLALHRILGVTMSTLDFERPKEFDLEQYDNEGRFGYGDGERIRLSFEANGWLGEHLEETSLAPDQTITKIADGQVRIKATLVDSEHLTWWLRSFGDEVSNIRKRRIGKDGAVPGKHDRSGQDAKEAS